MGPWSSLRRPRRGSRPSWALAQRRPAMVRRKGEKGDLTAAVAEAESAVSSVKDPELRRAAFEKVLQHLLEGQVGSARRRKAVGHAQAKSKAPSGPTGRI